MVDQLEFQCPDSGWHPQTLGSIVPLRAALSAAFTNSKAAAANVMHLKAVTPCSERQRDPLSPPRECSQPPDALDDLDCGNSQAKA